jgi:hypothetical protein
VRGTAFLIAALTPLASCHEERGMAGTAAQLTIISGRNQSDTVAHCLRRPLVVAAQDQFSDPVPEAVVRWVVTAGGGSVSDVSTLTDSRGWSAVTWTLGPNAGQQTVTASLAAGRGQSVAYAAIALPGRAAALAFQVQPGNAAPGVPVAPPIQVAVVDAFGNTVSYATSVVVLALGTNPSSATLSGTTEVSAVNGIATFSDVRINRYGTGYTLHATSGGLTEATSHAFNVAGTIVRMVFTVPPTSTRSGVPIAPAVQVTAEDSAGNQLTGFTGTVVITIGSNPAGGTLSGTTEVVASFGVATYPNLSIDRPGSGYTLVAFSAGLGTITSVAFDVLSGSGSRSRL